MSYQIIENFFGYRNKTDKTNLPETDKNGNLLGYLIAGSKNVISTDGDLVGTRPGYKLYGVANTALNNIESSFEWTTTSGTERPLRAYDDELEVDIGGTWTRVLDGWASVAFNFTVYYDTNEEEDILLFLNGDNNVYSWSGALATLSSAKGTNITGTGIAFVDANPDTITDTGNGFVTAGFVAGDVITVTGTSNNNKEYTIASVVAGTITLVDGDAVTAESAGASMTITAYSITKNGSTSFAEARFIANGSDYDKKVLINGTTYTYTGGEFTTTLTGFTTDPSGEAVDSNIIQKPTTHSSIISKVVQTSTTIAFVDSNPDTITDSGNGFVTSGFLAGQTINVSGTTNNNGNFTIKSVVAGTITLIAGDSLTAESAGSSFIIRTTGYNADLISTINNEVYYGSTVDDQVLKAEVNNFDNLVADTTVGGPRLFSLDATPTAFIPQEETMYISAGKSQWYEIKKELASDLTAESISIKRLKSGTSQSAQAQSMVENVKNYIFFITNEPTLDQLGRVENISTPQNLPLSDPIKTDFDEYDFTGAHIKFFKNNVYIAVPQQSLLLIYNMAKGFWEAPQVLPAGRLAIISDKLYLHSNAVPETYALSFGLKSSEQVHNDNGFAMEAIARFSYRHYGTRSEKKSFTDFYNEFYISGNTELTKKDFFEYQGIDGTQTEIYKGTDDNALFDTGGGGIGKENLGKAKLAGGASTDNLKKFRQVDTSEEKDFFEMFTQYSSNDIDQQWAILAFGPDVEPSINENFDVSK